MVRRLNPWPAFVDLFACLLIGTFAGFVLLSALEKETRADYEAEKRKNEGVSALRAEVERISNELHQAMAEDNQLQSKVRKCGEDTCIDVYAHFDLNGAKIMDGREVDSIRQVGLLMRSQLEQLPEEQRSPVEILVEGHTDNTQLSASADERTRYMYNWELSSRRATAVLYEFSKCGLRPPDFNILAIGYADTVPLCTEDTIACQNQNRRTTLRLRINTQVIDHAVGAGIP